MATKISILKNIISELRNSSPIFNSKDNLAVQFIMSQYRKYRVTDEQLCKAKEEMEYMANTYLCYLKSSRLELKIYDEFHGKGERTTAETAKLAGFEMPQVPK